MSGTIFGREPALWLGLLQVLLAAAVGFGFNLSGQQIALIMAVAVALSAFITRQAVTPVAAPNLPVGTSVNGGAAEVHPAGQ